MESDILYPRYNISEYIAEVIFLVVVTKTYCIELNAFAA